MHAAGKINLSLNGAIFGSSGLAASREFGSLRSLTLTWGGPFSYSLYRTLLILSSDSVPNPRKGTFQVYGDSDELRRVVQLLGRSSCPVEVSWKVGDTVVPFNVE